MVRGEIKTVIQKEKAVLKDKAVGILIAVLFVLASSPAYAGEDNKAEDMVLVPEGLFLMGAGERHGLVGVEVGVDAMPEHTVFLKAFYIDRFEVTNAQYKKFLKETGYPEPDLWGPIYNREYPPLRDSDPASDIRWIEADAYCRWAGKRLPTEEEWEKAARGADGRKYPWGNDWKDEATNSFEYSKERWDSKRLRYIFTVTEVGALKEDISPYGAFDMAGNVMEWTSSWYKAYTGSALERQEFGETYRVLRGGSWMAPKEPFSFMFNRHYNFPDEDDPHFGMRCAMDAGER